MKKISKPQYQKLLDIGKESNSLLLRLRELTDQVRNITGEKESEFYDECDIFVWGEGMEVNEALQTMLEIYKIEVK